MMLRVYIMTPGNGQASEAVWLELGSCAEGWWQSLFPEMLMFRVLLLPYRGEFIAFRLVPLKGSSSSNPLHSTTTYPAAAESCQCEM